MNRALYTADCLDILEDGSGGTTIQDRLHDESVDLIYLDPPFNSDSNYNLPFNGKDKVARPVQAFNDTWEWTEHDQARLDELKADPRIRALASIVQLATGIQPSLKQRKRPSLSSYLLYMGVRLRAMHRVLKPTGSIYLHCDPTASHWLKLVMDSIFGQPNFRNEIIWCYRGGGVPKQDFARKHDVIFRYSKSDNYHFNPQYAEYSKASKALVNARGGVSIDDRERDLERGAHMTDWWSDINSLQTWSPERTGYPTQKPLRLLERIINASSNEGDVVMDPFCGCGTTVHAAEKLGRRWVGIDISPFATGLIRERIVDNLDHLSKSDITVLGVPYTVQDARALATRDKFEFEKWACGHIGASGMFHEPGQRGADGGVDGLLEIYPAYPSKEGTKLAKEYAIVQVKGGNVTPDAVRALYATVKHYEVRAGVMVCFEDQMQTVENQRNRDTFKDFFGTYPVIQGYSIEDLLNDKPLSLPNYGGRRKSGTLVSM